MYETSSPYHCLRRKKYHRGVKKKVEEKHETEEALKVT